MKNRLRRLVASLFFLILTMGLAAQAQQGAPEVVTIDGSAATHPFPHFWEQMFGSGRAILSLRESYRDDLRDVKKVTDFKYVRFHGIFLDEVGVYDEDAQGHPIYNFSYVDQIYDGLLQNGVRPFVELSFMPKKLAAKEVLQAFWYKPNVSPPKDWNQWGELVYQFAKHLVDRYGIDEVSQWYFEVWNEPNLDFWAGDPREATYWELYDHSANAIKRVNSRLRVGGPATAQAAWVDAFLQHCAQNHIPVDFVSTHVYGNDPPDKVFGTNESVPRNKFVCRAVRKVHEQVKASALPDIPLIWSEFNASYFNEPAVTDSAYMGPWLADTIRQCDGLVDIMSYWAFSDVFEEQGVVKQPFYGGFGLIAAGGILKPAYGAFELLHQLGDQRIAVDSDSAIATRRPNGSISVALWNLVPPGESGPTKTVTLRLKNIAKVRQANIWRVDREHGNPHPAYENMGSPRYPSAAQVVELRKAAAISTPKPEKVKNGALNVELPPDGLAVIELK